MNGIYFFAFNGCTKLKDVTCLSTTPPEASAYSFENYNGYLYVPCESREAPAFVVTISGKKIANANLKSGVYFVVVDGETVGVSVR